MRLQPQAKAAQFLSLATPIEVRGSFTDYHIGPNPGDVVDGQISNIVDFGAFVDLDGMDGLIHISELSWSHVNHPSEVLEIGPDTVGPAPGTLVTLGSLTRPPVMLALGTLTLMALLTARRIEGSSSTTWTCPRGVVPPATG